MARSRLSFFTVNHVAPIPRDYFTIPKSWFVFERCGRKLRIGWAASPSPEPPSRLANIEEAVSLQRRPLAFPPHPAFPIQRRTQIVTTNCVQAGAKMRRVNNSLNCRALRSSCGFDQRSTNGQSALLSPISSNCWRRCRCISASARNNAGRQWASRRAWPFRALAVDQKLNL